MKLEVYNNKETEPVLRLKLANSTSGVDLLAMDQFGKVEQYLFTMFSEDGVIHLATLSESFMKKYGIENTINRLKVE